MAIPPARSASILHLFRADRANDRGNDTVPNPERYHRVTAVISKQSGIGRSGTFLYLK